MESGSFTLLAGNCWVLIAFPLLVAALLLLVRMSDSWLYSVGVGGVGVSFGYAVVLFIMMLGEPEPITVQLYTWLSIGDAEVTVSLLIDQLSILFALLVAGIGTLVAIYSVGYLSDEPERRRFFGLLNLFIAAMLLLVLADNYVLLFVGWEAVGLVSYLLIGFWQEKEVAANAAKKAFVMNRVADLGLLSAIAVLLTQIGTVRFTAVAEQLGAVGGSWAGVVGFALLLAACAKSAQVPLQSWLLDAMESPTPASALIHSATMVAAGGYLILRSLPIYMLAPTARLAVLLIGVLTLFGGAWMAATGRDIKRVLACSTTSQLGYLMLAAGLGPVGAVFAVFQLLTHGVIKAGLFLAVGTLTRRVGRSDLQGLGGLVKVLPYTFVAFACGYLATIGVPFLSGFYAKGHIIATAWETIPAFGALAVVGVGLGAFYMTRLLLLTFTGTARWQEAPIGAETSTETGAENRQPLRGSVSMRFSLTVLSLLALGGGLALNGWLPGWLQPVFAAEVSRTGLLYFDWLNYVTLGLLFVVVVGTVIYYRKVTPIWFKAASTADEVALVRIGAAELYADDALQRGVVAPLSTVSARVSWTESEVLENGARHLWRVIGRTSILMRRLQSGNVRTYVLLFVAGTAVLVSAMLLWAWV
ncbi:MAG: NADH-quinone oxidoreductase subunit L [Propionibacteriaceae bacterium]|nr:NADH-quinone oxidoreductase subunit L [Propionibacteriaceae bacterium]